MKPYLKPIQLIALVSIILSMVMINSCRKDTKSNPKGIADPAISQAKLWYENAYPASNSSFSNGKLVTQSVGTTTTFYDLSQLIKPDWSNAVKYIRYSENVIELPIDPGISFSADLKNMTANKIYSNKKYSRSSFIILGDTKNYKAYIMMIIADSSYINNDLTKLALNTY